MKIILPALLALVTLACGVAVPITEVNAPIVFTPVEIVPGPTQTAIPTISIRVVSIVTVATALNIRSCGSLACEVVAVVYAGTELSAICSGDWCLLPTVGWFCLPAAELTDGCE